MFYVYDKSELEAGSGYPRVLAGLGLENVPAGTRYPRVPAGIKISPRVSVGLDNFRWVSVGLTSKLLAN